MGTVNLIELASLKIDDGGHKADVQPLALNRQVITSSTSSGQSATLNTATKFVRIKPSADVYIAWGTDPTATKVTAVNQDFCAAGQVLDIFIDRTGLKFAFIE